MCTKLTTAYSYPCRCPRRIPMHIDGLFRFYRDIARETHRPIPVGVHAAEGFFKTAPKRFRVAMSKVLDRILETDDADQLYAQFVDSFYELLSGLAIQQA